MSADSFSLFQRWMTEALAQWPGHLDAAREREYRALVDGSKRLATETGFDWTGLPALVAEIFGSRGFAWNGIYARRDSGLELVAAKGPPVCALLEVEGALYESGMCYDGLLMNQTLVAFDVKRWPGYVSCDGESGLQTVSGIVSPIRNEAGTPIGVWDLDAVQTIAAEDGPFFDRYFASLSSLFKPSQL